jgi:Transposase protein
MLNGAPIEVELVKDVPEGGLLFTLPALLLLGLLSESPEMLSMPEGFYPLESIFLLRMTAREGNQIAPHPHGPKMPLKSETRTWQDRKSVNSKSRP